METTIIVLVADRDDPKHGEITILDNSQKAERLVETLLEAGFEQERIRIFAGSEMDIAVTTRPVVTLIARDGPGSGRRDHPASETPETLEEAPTETNPEPEMEEAPSTPYMRDGIRFSSLFRSS